MRRLIYCRRGILFTIGLMFLTFVILALAILIFHNAQEYEGIIAKLAVLDRIYDLDMSIGQSMGFIFDLRSGVSINITDNGVSFEEILPNDNIAAFNNSLHQFKQFIESNLSNVNLTIANMEEMPLTVNPMDISYKHKDNWSDIEVIPAAVNFDGYSLFITSDRNVSCSWSFDNGGFGLSLEVIGDNTNCELRTEQINPNPLLNNVIRVDSIGEGNIILIKVDNNGRLLINLTEDIIVTARTTILTNLPGVDVRADSLNLKLDFGDSGVYKESEVRIK